MIPKAERDADKAICEAATQGLWTGFETGILVGSVWVVSNQPDSRGCIMRQVDASAAANAVNRLPLYIAALDEMERRIAAVKARALEYAASEERADRQHGAGMREALKILRGEK